MKYEQLLKIKELGIDIEDKNYEEVVDVLIFRFQDLLEEVEQTERQRFRKEILRIKKPTN